MKNIMITSIEGSAQKGIRTRSTVCEKPPNLGPCDHSTKKVHPPPLQSPPFGQAGSPPSHEVTPPPPPPPETTKLYHSITVQNQLRRLQRLVKNFLWRLVFFMLLGQMPVPPQGGGCKEGGGGIACTLSLEQGFAARMACR